MRILKSSFVRFVVGALAIAIAQAGASANHDIATLRTSTSTFVIDEHGALSSIAVKDVGNCLAVGQPAPLLSVRVSGKLYAPDRATWNAKTGRLTLTYAIGVSTTVSADAKPTHVVFRLLGVKPSNQVDLVVWGPYPTRIRDIVGETVGVVRDERVAVGIQALNTKTLGGLPKRESDEEPGVDGEDRGVYHDLSPELVKGQGWRGNTAIPTEFGSELRAYCRDRSKPRVIANWGHERYVAPAFYDGGVVGSKIALFACPAAKALATIGKIEIAEGLPHPMIDGVWGKVSPGATASYLIVDFSEQNVDRAIEMTRRAGLKYLYHSSPFETWGHFKLKPDLFPHGWDGLKKCVDRARAAGVRIGFHTLSNFITPNDAYVTPVPDRRLARIGSSALTAGIDAAQTEIPISDPTIFRDKQTLNTIVIDHELIRYKAVTDAPPWRLYGCERAAWGTFAARHTIGASVGLLLDHPYKTFHGDASLSIEIARNIAKLFNYVGALQTSFDGLEGTQSTGMGNYGAALFTKAWYDALSPALRGRVINDASNPGHFDWHINTRMNWGEPWYAGFRDSQTLYRFKNQVYFERNYFPRMLGWFALRPDTSVEDAEWLLARAAGFDAGFALATSVASTAQLSADPNSADTSKHFGAAPAILRAVKEWETARMSGAFPSSVRALLRDNNREFHLQAAGTRSWDVYEAHVVRLAFSSSRATDEFTVPPTDQPQPLRLIVTSPSKSPIEGLTISLDGSPIANLKQIEIPVGGSLEYSGGQEAIVYDATRRELSRIPTDPTKTRVARGRRRLAIESMNGDSIKVELRTFGPAVRVTSPTRR